MPHSGGGGSHGGGSHGGSHGSHGSSHRSSHHYFPGSRRYCRRYPDGREEYFYSNGRPTKPSIGSVIFLILFGGFFVGMMIPSMILSAPKRLDEKYEYPKTRVIDNIDVIKDDDALEEILKDYNDLTGICPIVYTMVPEEYEGVYDTLEDFAYSKYVKDFNDEQHYLILYSVPLDQIDDYQSGKIDVPDYEWEVMMGNETDNLIKENYENAFVETVQNGLEDGDDLGVVLEKAFKDLYAKDKSILGKSALLQLENFVPLLLITLFFGFMIFIAVKNYRKQKGVEYEEVPLTDDDIGGAATGVVTGRYSGALSEVLQNRAGTSNANINSSLTVIKVISIIFLFPFMLAGLGIIFGSLAAFGKGEPSAVFLLIFGIFWTAITFIIAASILKAFKKMKENAGSNPGVSGPAAGNTRVDRSEVGKPELGSSDSGSSVFGSSDFADAGFGDPDFGSSDFGSSDFGSSDFGSSAPDYGSFSGDDDYYSQYMKKDTGSLYEDDDDDLRRKGYE